MVPLPINRNKRNTKTTMGSERKDRSGNIAGTRPKLDAVRVVACSSVALPLWHLQWSRLRMFNAIAFAFAVGRSDGGHDRFDYGELFGDVSVSGRLRMCHRCFPGLAMA